jgi:sugar lactone lactonase YvrE
MKIRSKNFVQLALVLAVLLLNSINARADTVYVWSNDGTIQKFATNGVGSLVTNNLSGWNGPVGLALDNVGNLYVGVPDESYIWRFTPDNTRSLIGYIDSISGLAFDSTGNLFATIPNYTEILKLDYGQGYGYYFGASTNYSQSHLSYPINLAFDSVGNIYVANNTNANPYSFLSSPSPYDNTIEKFSTNFTDLSTFATSLNNPSGLAFDSGWNLFVANSGTNGSLKNTIIKFTTGGVSSTFATASNGLNSPQGLAFDSAGNLYVANSGNGTIEKFTPDGTGSVFASGLNSPTSIAIFPGLKLWSATTIKLANPKTMPSGVFQFDFIDNAGLAFTVLGTTNVSISLTNWTALGGITEVSPGQYQFTDPQATNNPQRFYRVHSP